MIDTQFIVQTFDKSFTKKKIYSFSLDCTMFKFVLSSHKKEEKKEKNIAVWIKTQFIIKTE